MVPPVLDINGSGYMMLIDQSKTWIDVDISSIKPRRMYFVDFYQSSNTVIQENAFEILSAKQQPACSGLTVLKMYNGGETINSFCNV